MIEVFRRLRSFQKYFSLFNILILSGVIALFSTIDVSSKKYKFKQCSPKISVHLMCNTPFQFSFWTLLKRYHNAF